MAEGRMRKFTPKNTGGSKGRTFPKTPAPTKGAFAGSDAASSKVESMNKAVVTGGLKMRKVKPQIPKRKM
jgi:hypothetical protein